MRAILTGVWAVVLLAGQALGQTPVVIELREESSIIGGEVRLKQVARWGRGDNAFFAGGLSDLVLVRLEPGQRTVVLDVGSVREVLAGAGVHPTEVTFRGSARVTVTRLDSDTAHAQRPLSVPSRDLGAFLDRAGAPAVEEGEAQLASGRMEAVEAPSGRAGGGRMGPVMPEPRLGQPPSAIARSMGSGPGGMVVRRTLREALVQDIADRLGLKPDDVELTFEPTDERVLRLSEPAFTWSIAGNRVRNLGVVSWSVTLWAHSTEEGAESARAGSAHRVELIGRARAWQQQVVTRRALVPGQLVREEDLEVRRMLVDRLPEEMLLTREQALMMQASRAIPPGTVLAGRMLDPVLLVRSGQLVSVALRQGAVEVKAVARAMEGGAFGQTIRVKNEQTNDVLQVTVIGPQEARLGPGHPKE